MKVTPEKRTPLATDPEVGPINVEPPTNRQYLYQTYDLPLAPPISVDPLKTTEFLPTEVADGLISMGAPEVPELVVRGSENEV